MYVFHLECNSQGFIIIIKDLCNWDLNILTSGLKPGQRKVLFTCLKRNDKREVKVAQLAGSVAELSAYHHGEVSDER